jgi:cytosine/adenosine deaminase-related metal-dependent hydrolase
MAVEAGREVVGAPAGGVLAAGAAADLLVVDRAALDRDALAEVEPLDLLFARGRSGHVRELIVAGRTVVRDGRVLGVDLDAAHAELRARYRAGLGSRSRLQAAMPAMERAIRGYYLHRLGCC